jgi:hypothetical protein
LLALDGDSDAPGECATGRKHDGRVPFSEFADSNDIAGPLFDGEAPDTVCSYCWSNVSETETSPARPPETE